MARTIYSVGLEIPEDSIEHFDYEDEVSLCDADIIIFDPDYGDDWPRSLSGMFQGKPSLSETSSFKLRQATQFWKKELLDACNAGRTIIVTLSAPREVFVDTGLREFSGTGRNQKTTTTVRAHSSYEALPFTFDEVRAHNGKKIRPSKDLGELAAFWTEFSAIFGYQASVLWEQLEAGLLTSNGRAVGGIVRTAKGAIVLLPAIQYPQDYYDGDPNDPTGGWTAVAKQHGKCFVAAIVALDKELRAGAQRTPAPNWANAPELQSAKEATVIVELNSLQQKVESLQNQQQALTSTLDSLGQLRWLLYEKGKPLEAAILHALGLLGFTAAPYDDGESEFDALFTSVEGAFLGEAEGKDTKSINIDKLRQLESNIQEDFAREDVKEHKHGVLFGNAHRLSALSKRPEFFTKKCLTGAQRSKIALVRTTDLFVVARYLEEKNNKSFAKKCRQAILNAAGSITNFPKVPASQQKKTAAKKRS